MSDKYIFGLFFLLFLSSCKKGENNKWTPVVFNYFVNMEATSFRYYKEGNKKQKLFVDSKYIRNLDYKQMIAFDTFNFKIPVEYKKDEDFHKRGSIKFKDRYDNVIYFQLLVSTSVSSLDFFNEIYQYAMEKKYPFHVNSAKYFKTKKENFVTYDVDIKIDDKSKHVLGFDFTTDNNKYLDITYIKIEENTDIDRIIFSDIINSIKVDTSSLMPYYNDIIKETEIKIENEKE